MAITRIAQLIADLRVATDYIVYPSPGTPSAPSASSAQAHTGAYSYAYGQSASRAIGVAPATPPSNYRIGYWMRRGSSIGQSQSLVFLMSGAAGNNHYESQFIGLRVENTLGELQLVRPTTASGANNLDILAAVPWPASFLLENTWLHFGATHHIHATNGYYSVYLNGQRVLTYQGDTRPYGQGNGVGTYGSTIPRLFAAGDTIVGGATSGGANNLYLDDIYWDDMGDAPDGPVPARRFLLALPDGAGVDDAWTPEPTANNYANVDENPNDGDATYNKALSANLRDTFTVSNITLPVDHRIVAVLPSPFAKRLDSEIANGLSVHAWDGAQYDDSPDLALSMSYDAPTFHRFTTRPDGGAWDEASFNAMQFGYRSRGTF